MIASFGNLLELETAYPDLITSDSPTQRVGAPPMDELTKVPHEKPMLSLDSITDREDVLAFDARMRRELETEDITYTAEPKFDGLSVELVYDHGAFVRGSTRGDGRTGEDVTVNLADYPRPSLAIAARPRPSVSSCRAGRSVHAAG